MVGKQESDQDLPTAKYEEARSFIGTINPILPGFLAAYTLEDDVACPSSVFNPEVKRVLEPVMHWQYAAKLCDELPGAKAFCELMAKLSTCPSSSAGLECVFSSFGVVHNKLRNRLSNARLEKLVKVYVNLRWQNQGQENTDNIDYVYSLMEEALEIED